jgi:hypothetical protein
MSFKPLPFLKGLSQSSDHMTTPEGALLQMDDWQINYGWLRPRYGQTVVNSGTLGTSGLPISLGFYFDSTSIVQPQVIAVQDTKIFRAAYAEDLWRVANNISFTDITGTSTLVISYPATFDQLNNVMIIASRSAPQQITAYNVNASPLAGSPPTDVTIVKVCNNIAFLSGAAFQGTPNPTHFSRVFWSNIGDPQTWPSTNFLDFRYGDGDFITALGAIGNNLIIFKNNSVGSLSTQSVSVAGTVTLGPLYTVFQGIGCPGNLALDNLPDGRIVFLACDWNLYLCDGTGISNLTNFPFPKPSIYEGALSRDTLVDPSRGIQGPIVRYYPNYSEVWLFVPDKDFSANPNYATGYIYAYNIIKDTWRRITGMTLASLLCVSQQRLLNSAGVFVSHPSVMLAGTFNLSATNNILYMDNETVTSPKDYLGNTITAKATFSVSNPEIISDEDYRSIDIPSSNSGSGTVWFGFNGTMNGSSSKTLSSSTIRNAIPIPYLGSNVRPESIQIQIQDTNSLNKVYTPYLSEEVLS